MGSFPAPSEGVRVCTLEISVIPYLSTVCYRGNREFSYHMGFER